MRGEYRSVHLIVYGNVAKQEKQQLSPTIQVTVPKSPHFFSLSLYLTKDSDVTLPFQNSLAAFQKQAPMLNLISPSIAIDSVTSLLKAVHANLLKNKLEVDHNGLEGMLKKTLDFCKELVMNHGFKPEKTVDVFEAFPLILLALTVAYDYAHTTGESIATYMIKVC